MNTALRRLEPVADRVRELVDRHEVTAVLRIVRDFADDRAAPAPMVELDSAHGVVTGPEPHYLLGWVLTARHVQLLAHIRAEIDCDEYS